jgi:hypothetical protein
VTGHDEAWSAEPALQAVPLHEGLLDDAEFALPAREPFDSCDVASVGLHCEQQTRSNGLAFEKDRAAAAGAMLASEMRAGEPASRRAGSRPMSCVVRLLAECDEPLTVTETDMSAIGRLRSRLGHCPTDNTAPTSLRYELVAWTSEGGSRWPTVNCAISVSASGRRSC